MSTTELVPSSMTDSSTAELVPVSRVMSLWQIDSELQALMEQAQEEEMENGTVSPATFTALQVYFQAAVAKVDRIAGFLKLEKVLEPAYKEEKRRLEDRWRAYQNGFKRCKQMLLEFLQARGETKIKGATNTISRQANSQASLEIEGAVVRYRAPRTEATRISKDFQRLDVTLRLEFWERLVKQYAESPESMIEIRKLFDSMANIAGAFVDEDAVREALQAGEEVDGAELKFGEHIRVR